MIMGKRNLPLLGMAFVLGMLLPVSSFAEENDGGTSSVVQADYLCLYAWNQAISNSWPIGQVRKLVFTSTDVAVSLWQGGNTYRYPYGSVRKITFADEPLSSAIEPAATNGAIMYYNASRESLVIADACGNARLQLYSLSGAQVFSAIVSEGRSEHSLASLAAGVYVAKLTDQTNTYTLKLQIR